MTNPRTIACTAGHMVGGLLAGGSQRVALLLTAFEVSGGYFEMIDEVTQHAAYTCALFDAGYAVVGEYPGVGDYQVSEPFGEWVAERILVDGGKVDPRAAQEELRRLMFEFFSGAAQGGEGRERLRFALREVQP